MKPQQILHRNAGARRSLTAANGSVVTLYDGHKAHLDTDRRWQTCCETHGILVAHTTLAIANRHLPHPEEWCEECREVK